MPTTSARWRLFLAVVMIAAGLLSVNAAPARAAQTPVTVQIFSVLEVEDADGDGSDGDFFPEVSIGGQPFETRGRIEDDDFRVSDWTFTRTVDTPDDDPFIDVTIRLWDYDSGLAGDDDFMDISAKNDDVELNLTFNVLSRTWFGDLSSGQTVAQGDGDHGFPEANDGRIAKIIFDVTTTGTGDVDGDGIPDTVERFGINFANTPTNWVGMDPCRKDILLQLDWMQGAADGHSHQPKPAAATELVNAFNAAPVDAVNPCPYGGDVRARGIGLRLLPGRAIAEAAVMAFDNAYRTARSTNFDPNLEPFAQYGLFVHDQQAGSSSSGLCCERERGSRDILVSLGSWRDTCVGPGPDGVLNTPLGGDDVMQGTSIDMGPNRNCNSTAAGDDSQDIALNTGAANYRVGTVRDQSGTVMHELGHSLSLGHGGNDPTNYKPNYLSVMNYSFDPGGIPIDGAGNSRLDYSGAALPALNKSTLSEGAGIGDGTDFTTWSFPGGSGFGQGNAALNWNGNTNADGTARIDAGAVNVDINAADDVCIQPGGDGELDTDPEGDDSKVGGAHPAILDGADGVCQTTDDDDDDTGRAPVLNGFNDWANLRFRAVAAPGSGARDGSKVAADHGPDVTYEEVLDREQDRDAFFDPDLTTTKTVDQTDANAGDPLAYQVTVRNEGTGTATAVKLVDTLPDGTRVERTMADIAPGRDRTESFSYTIPCDATDGSTVTNSATVTATDLGHSPEADTTDNTGRATTTVHAPKLTVTATSTPQVGSGESTTTQVTVANVGSGGASNVQLVASLPVDVYYSQALDTGAGPQPTSVTREADGTTTLRWALGALAGGGTTSVDYTVRPSLLFTGGQTFTQAFTATFENANGCAYAPVTASTTTTVVEQPPTRDPRSHGYWKTHPEQRTAELRARIQATYQRYDGADGSTPDGQLSDSEAQAALSTGGNMPGPLDQQMMAALFDVASRRINASTRIGGKLAERLGTKNVGDAIRYGFATLAMPVDSSTAGRYSDATTVLDQIVNNRIEIYS